MSRVGYGMLVGLAGAAYAAWWRQRRRMAIYEWNERGDVIFSNAPQVSEMD